MARKRAVDPVPLERKFGYAAMVEKEAIYKQLKIDNPDWSFMRLYMFTSNEYQRRHENDPTYAETSRRLSEKCPTIYVDGKHSASLTNEQIAYLMEKLAGCNDPVGISILEFCMRAAATATKEFT